LRENTFIFLLQPALILFYFVVFGFLSTLAPHNFSTVLKIKGNCKLKKIINANQKLKQREIQCFCKMKLEQGDQQGQP